MPVYYESGDALKAERIAVEARSIDRIHIVEGSGKHRIQATRLKGSAYCVIELPLRQVRERKTV